MRRLPAICFAALLLLRGARAAEEAPAPPDPEALYREAEAHYRAGFLLAAREELRRLLRLKPGDKRSRELALEVDRALVEQVEKSFRRREHPPAEPAPEATPGTDPNRRARLSHERAQARALLKSGAFTQARAAFEALRAAYPEASGELAGDLRDLDRAEQEAKTDAEAQANLQRERARSEAETSAEDARRRRIEAEAAASREQEDLEAVRAAEPSRALRESESFLTQGRFDEARQALGATRGEEAEALRGRIAEAEAQKTVADRRAREAEAARTRQEAVAAALASARAGDIRGARAKLYALRAQDPADRSLGEALRELDRLEANAEPDLSRRGEEAEKHLAEARDLAERRRLYQEACSLQDGGFLEEARARLARVAEASPGAWEVDRRLSRIDEALRDREAPEPASDAARYEKGMACYERDDLGRAEALLRTLADVETLSLWRRSRVTKALADITQRRDRARTLLEAKGSGS